MIETRNWQAFDFGVLPSFSKREAGAWNALARLFTTPVRWQDWIAEGLASLLETPAGFAIRVLQRHTVDPQHAETVFTSDTGELMLGRDESCDVRLAPRSVASQHARIFTQAGRCFIEDLGGAVGTFLNDTRLLSNQPAPVTSGDRFTIFPYAFTVELTERWVRGGAVAVHAGPVLPRHPHLLERPAPVDRTIFALEVQPIGAEFFLEANPGFLERLSAQVLAPLCPGAAARLGIGTADTGLFELIAAAILERVNRDLRLPMQARLAPTCVGGGCNEAGGISFSFTIRLAELTGAFRLLIGDRAIRSLIDAAPPAPAGAPPGVSWKFPVSAGSAELSHDELGLIEPSDVVLLAREPVLLFANSPERGWRLRTRPGNLSQAAIEKYFERPCLSDREAQPDFSNLPVRLHAIIGEKEMTLAEAGGLVPGTVVELDAARSEPVRIALNGKYAGTGELVEVDGRLGIRILAWRASSS